MTTAAIYLIVTLIPLAVLVPRMLRRLTPVTQATGSTNDQFSQDSR
jgi:hypothetical protein